MQPATPSPAVQAIRSLALVGQTGGGKTSLAEALLVQAGAIGAPSARLMFTHALRGRGIAAEDVAELLDETSQELRFSRQLLQATMENVSQGIAVADAEARIVAWNSRYL